MRRSLQGRKRLLNNLGPRRHWSLNFGILNPHFVANQCLVEAR